MCVCMRTEFRYLILLNDLVFEGVGCIWLIVTTEYDISI